MAYLVLVLGAVLSIGGALSIFQGAGIVQVERGWTGVIAGATSLTGGIITIALGLILRALLDLRAKGPSGVPPRSATEIDPAELGLPATATAGVSAPAADLEGSLLAAFLAPKSEPAADRADDGEHAGFDPQVHEPPPVSQEQLSPGQIESERPELPKPRVKISFKTPAEPLPPEETPSPPEQQPPVPAMDDWLDRAFSSLDDEVAAAPAEPPRQPSARDAVTAASQAEIAAGSLPRASHEYDDAVAELDPPSPKPPASHEPEPAPQPSAAQTAAAPPPQSAVIGRYEADGTSYVMFADGSIEAQSNAGVYRFSSMTELKAFIEGTG